MKTLIASILMTLGTINCGTATPAPKGELVYCRYCCDGVAGLGANYCTLLVDEQGQAQVAVVLDEGNRFDDPVIKRSYPVDKAVVDSLARLLEESEVYKLDGYHVNEDMTGGYVYSFYVEYASGDKVRASWYGHGIKPEAFAAYSTIERFFAPWCQQARKDEESETRINRVRDMEQRFNQLAKAVRRRKAYPGLREDAQTLMEYMDSGKWKEDFEADERGEIPKDLKRGVLSEDRLYNLVTSERLHRLLSSAP